MTDFGLRFAILLLLSLVAILQPGQEGGECPTLYVVDEGPEGEGP